jgi:hypothetical protein
VLHPGALLEIQLVHRPAAAGPVIGGPAEISKPHLIKGAGMAVANGSLIQVLGVTVKIEIAALQQANTKRGILAFQSKCNSGGPCSDDTYIRFNHSIVGSRSSVDEHADFPDCIPFSSHY